MLCFSIKISQANQELSVELSNAKAIGESAKTSRIQSQNILNDSYALIGRYDKFLNPTGIKSADVALKIEEVISLSQDLIHDGKTGKV